MHAARPPQLLRAPNTSLSPAVAAAARPTPPPNHRPGCRSAGQSQEFEGVKYTIEELKESR
jgi:hypothetical protein